MSGSQVLGLEREGPVAILRLNRPEALNALNQELMDALVTTLAELEADEGVRCVVLTGSQRSFAAGGDVREMLESSAVEMFLGRRFGQWEAIRRFPKPLIAAVNGYALGGGNELAMACDLVVAGESARFGQPEVGLGLIPGAGGTQRLTRAVGKARAMELVLTGRHLSAQEALRWGLVNRVTPPELCLEEALALAREIAAQPPVAVRLAKEAVLKAQETGLAAGLQFERQAFYLTFATEDQREGIRAFLEKRPPRFQGR